MLADEILELLQTKISANEFDCYIKQLKFNEKASNEDFIVFNATSELMAKFIKTRYAEKIAYLYEVKTGKKPEVEITSQTKLKNIKQNQVNVKQIKAQSSILNPGYTFENFVCGDSNQFAF